MRNEYRQVPRTGVILMAAGRSERFGRNKLLADFGGRPLVTYAMQLLRNLREPWAPVSEPGNEPCISADPHVITCHDEVAALSRQYGLSCTVYGGGLQSDTIRAALGIPEAGTWSGCLFMTGDQPYLTMESVIRLLQAFAADQQQIYRLAWGDQAGNPVLFPARYFEILRKMQGDSGGNSLIRKQNLPVILLQAGSERELLDADTEEELQYLETCGK